MKLDEAIFYHLYPLGALGVLNAGPAPEGAPGPLSRVTEWIPAMRRVGANALWLGPVFASERHGYDTVDFRAVDPRLGRNEDLRKVSAALRDAGVGLVLDAVFNHVGRSHPIVQAVVQGGPGAPEARWIAGYDPDHGARGGLPFGYEGWKGHYDLVKLDTGLEEVQDHLLDIARAWIDEFDLAGLRLDAADCLDRGFMRRLGAACRDKNPDFFLIGEAVRGDEYPALLDEAGLDAVTDFEAYKGLWSSYNDKNLHEIAWTLDRLFGDGGICRGKLLYNFADNHDVDRLASTLRDPAGLYPLYGLLFSMPGVPSVYYGSEYGFAAKRDPHDDAPVRPALDPARLPGEAPHPDLARAIARFAAARRDSPAVRVGGYRRLAVESEALAFCRWTDDDLAVIAVNIGDEPAALTLEVPEAAGRTLVDQLDPQFSLPFGPGGATRVKVPPRWLRWLAPG